MLSKFITNSCLSNSDFIQSLSHLSSLMFPLLSVLIFDSVHDLSLISKNSARPYLLSRFQCVLSPIISNMPIAYFHITSFKFLSFSSLLVSVTLSMFMLIPLSLHVSTRISPTLVFCFRHCFLLFPLFNRILNQTHQYYLVHLLHSLLSYNQLSPVSL